MAQHHLYKLFETLRLENQQPQPQLVQQQLIPYDAAQRNPLLQHTVGSDATARSAVSVYPSPTPQTGWPNAANVTGLNMEASLKHMLLHDYVVCCVRYSWDGQYLATASRCAAHIFDAETAQKLVTFSEYTASHCDAETYRSRYVRAVCFSPDGKSLVTGSEDHVIRVWDVRNGKVRHRIVGHDAEVTSIDVSSNSQFIVSGAGDNKEVKLWNLETGSSLSTLGEHMGPLDSTTSVSVSATCQYVAAGSLDHTVRVWDVESARLVRQFEGHTKAVYSVAFSPDGRRLLSGSLDGTLKLWDLEASVPTRQCILSLSGHTSFVLSVAFSPCGRWLISGSKDRTVRIWDLRQMRIGLKLTRHNNSVISFAHNPVSATFATGCGDFHTRTWLYSS